MSDPSFLGRGWAFPPSFSLGGAEVQTVSGVESIQHSLRILLGTVPGERVLQEAFGCDLPSLLFKELDQGLINTIERLVGDAVLDYEPRIVLDKLAVEQSPADPSLLHIHLFYTVQATNTRYNMVFPFYLTEATLLPRG
jgi:phage baseplate assembly protein W